MDILYVVMPAYNEAENIETVIHAWYPVLKAVSGNICTPSLSSGYLQDPP